MRKIIFIITFSLSSSLLMFSSVLAGTHTYFDMLSAKTETILSKPYRTQAEINADPYGGPGNVVYDSTEDAAMFTLPAGDGSSDASVPLADQLRPKFTPTPLTAGNLLVFYELKHESGFASNGDVNGLDSWKSVQIEGDPTIPRRQKIEPRYRFNQVNLPYVARVDVRIYGGPDSQNPSGYQVGPFDSIAPQVGEFNVLPDVWVRHWLFIDFDNKQLSYWVGDENRTNVIILDHVGLDYNLSWPGQNFNTFWFEFNSSRAYNLGAPALNCWARNLVILKNVSNSSSLVAQGDSGNSGTGTGTGTGTIQPPTNARVQ